MAEKMILVDGNSLMYRAFHALPLLDNGEGLFTNAAVGFLSMLFRVFREEAPTHCAVAFDMHGPTFRHDQYEDYKAGRAPTPDELRPQFPLVKQLLEAMHIAVIECEKYEADDILGTWSLQCEHDGMDALIVTGDRDAFQLAGERVSILYTKRGISDTYRVNPAYLQETYGLTPDQMIDLKGLMGDSSDNIPGVPGVGEKTALKLLHQYDTLENVLEHADAEQKGKLRERLMEFSDQARFSKDIATINRHAPIDLDGNALRLHDMRDGMAALSQYKLKALMSRLNALDSALLGNGQSGQAAIDVQTAVQWQVIESFTDIQAFAQWVQDQWGKNKNGAVAFVLEDALSIAFESGQQARIALGGDLLSTGLDGREALCALRCVLTGEGTKYLYDVKAVLGLLDGEDIMLNGEIFDAKLCAYVLNPGLSGYALFTLLEEEGIIGDASITTAGRVFTFCVNQITKMELDGLRTLYHEIELPLAYALYRMEKVGFLVDVDELSRLGAIYQAQIADYTAQIHALSEEPFNINSPKQLGEVLFEKLKLSGGKKTGRGWSTNAELLESVADQHEMIPLVLAYRKIHKLNSTYIEALQRLRAKDGRIHTSFDQVATVTGRISSLEPNLQNIPVRTSEGRGIRRAFISQSGWSLVDADYSQIELRVLAHMSKDPTMIEAFAKGQDIHRRTAAEVYGVSLDDVTPQMRSAAKAVNFGIVYGISDYGLARNIGVSRAEAAEFIARYFGRYPKVKAYMDAQVAEGKQNGYVTTLFARRRYLPELGSTNYNTRSFGERAAMNSPIQGSAADIIKIAMLKVDDAIKAGSHRARLILQVHDELIAECPDEECEVIRALLKSAMESAVELSVPLIADVSVGRNWNECKA